VWLNKSQMKKKERKENETIKGGLNVKFKKKQLR